ncbi:fatty acid desaturase family protein [Actinophytocola sp.]|uniref:fatty acid desaturase family protein n=1 Tax=Actinophytocola sp. TaxID=1872138 RepID=UPI002EDB06B9
MTSLATADKPPAEITRALREVSTVDNWRNALFLSADWLVIAVAVVAHVRWGGALVYVAATILIGTRMRALANLVHEAAHRKLFARRVLNSVVGRLFCAWPIFIDLTRYESDHRRHHQSLWRGADDPDVALYRLTGTERRSAGRISFTRFLGEHVLLVVVPVMPLRRLWSGITTRRLLAAAMVAGAVAVCWSAIPPLAAGVAAYWLLPWLTTYQMCAYWAELGEHGGLRDAGRLWGSRNWRGNVLTRWAIGSHSDDLYHLLHHWFPTVPHHRLRKLDRLCRQRWPRYAAEVRCTGFFVGGARGVSVLRDIWSGGAEPRS